MLSEHFAPLLLTIGLNNILRELNMFRNGRCIKYPQLKWFRRGAPWNSKRSFPNAISWWNTNLSWRYHVIHVLQKSFVFYFVVCEYKSNSFSLMSSSPVQYFEIIHQVWDIVGSTERSFNYTEITYNLLCFGYISAHYPEEGKKTADLKTVNISFKREI